MEIEAFKILFYKWMGGEVSPQEEQLFLEGWKQWQNDPQLVEWLKEDWKLGDSNETISQATTQTILSKIGGLSDNRVTHRVHFLKTAWFRWAAAIIILFGTGTYIFTHTSQTDKEVAIDRPSPKSDDIKPGYNRAVLTLSDGQTIVLDSTASETITDQTLAIENNNGQLVYKKNDLIAINTMTTPKGGQYQLTLTDGTRVWLNAASSITYPTAFTGKTREVRVTGEAYFEVKANKEKPFIVSTPKENITVLGTSFNVNVYPDEPQVKTSLIEGSIKINDRIVQPGEAYVNGKIIKTNIDQDIAWKNGIFNFSNTDLVAAMRQIERWYDIKVVYDGRMPALELQGKLPKEFTVQQIISAFTDNGLHYKLVGKQLIISP